MRWYAAFAVLALGCTESKGTMNSAQKADAAGSGRAGSADAAIAASVDAGVSYPLLGALYMQTPILNEMDFPTRDQEEGRRHGRPDDGPRRIGYLRRGAKVPVLPEPHFTANCREGWYELVSGGFVCARYATLDMNHPKLRSAPHAPYMDRPLPYDYAYNVANGTPLYRTVPSRRDRLIYEPWLVRKPKRHDVDVLDAGTVATATTAATDTVLGFSFGDPEDAGTPWYLRDWDGGKPQVTLDDLRADDGGPIVRRMVKGFYVALDTDIEVDHSKWWKTTSGYLAPYGRMIVAKPPTDFHGVWLNGAAASPPAWPAAVAQPDGGVPPYWVDKPPTHLPLAFVRWHAHEYTMSDDKKHVTRSPESLSRFTPLQLTGEKQSVGGALYYEVEGGFWMRSEHIIVMNPGPAPADLKPNEKWIDVNLDNQSLVAFVGTTPVFATLVSTGRMDDHDKTKDHRTPPGDFRIREKHIAATMDGDVASDGPYSIEDVPWIMYFNQSYALHGAFWHANFGHVQSHGCVNLAPDDARALFNWTDPQLPQGWHGVWATPENPGTRVIVHTIKPKPHWDDVATDDTAD